MKNPMTMRRVEIIEELRGLTSKKKLDSMLCDTTAMLRARLVWLKSSEEDQHDQRCLNDKPGRNLPEPVCVVELAPVLVVPHGFERISDRLQEWLTRDV